MSDLGIDWADILDAQSPESTGIDWEDIYHRPSPFEESIRLGLEATSSFLQVPVDVTYGLMHMAGLTPEGQPAPRLAPAVVASMDAVIGGRNFHDAYQQRAEELERKAGAITQAARMAGDIAGTFNPASPVGAAFQAGSKALTGVAAKAGVGKVAAKAATKAMPKAAQGVAAKFGAWADRVAGGGATYGILEAIRTTHTAEGEEAGAGGRVLAGLKGAAMWPLFELALGAGHVAARKFLETTARMRGPAAADGVMQEWARKVGAVPMEGESVEAYGKRILDTFIRHGSPGMPRSFMETGLALGIQSGVEAAGFGALEVEMWGHLLDPENRHKVLEHWAPTALAVLALKAGGIRNIPAWKRATSPAGVEWNAFDTNGVPRGLAQMGWSKRKDGTVALPGGGSHWFRIEGEHVVMSPELAKAVGGGERMGLVEGLDAIEAATIVNHIEARRQLPGTEVDTIGTTVVESRDPAQKSREFAWRWGRRLERSFQEGEYRDSDVAPRLFKPDATQLALAKQLRDWAAAQEALTPENKRIVESVADLLETRSRVDPVVDTTLQLLESGVAGKAIASARNASELHAVVRELGRVASGQRDLETSLVALSMVAEVAQALDAAKGEPAPAKMRREGPFTANERTALEGMRKKDLERRARELGIKYSKGGVREPRAEIERRIVERERDIEAAGSTHEIARQFKSLPLENLGGMRTTSVEIRRAVEKLVEAKIVKSRHRKTHGVGPETLGFYSPLQHLIRLSKSEDIVTLAHEAGHALHHRVLGERDMPIEAREELRKMGRELYGDPEPANGYVSEGFAEYAARRLAGGQDMAKVAPHAHAWIQSRLALPEHAKFREQFDALAKLYENWRTQGAVEKAIGIASGQAQVERTVGEWLKDTGDAFASKFIDSNHALYRGVDEVLRGRKITLRPTANPKTVIAALEGTAASTAHHVVYIESADIVGRRTGRSLADEMSFITREQNPHFLAYAYSRHVSWLHKWMREKRGEKYEEAISEREADYVVEQLGKKYPHFERVADAWSDFTRRIIMYAVQGNALSADAAARMFEANPYYIPLRRHFEEHELVSALRSGGGGRGIAGKGRQVRIQARRGSQRALKNPLLTTLEITYSIIANTNRARAVRSLVDFAKSVQEAGAKEFAAKGGVDPLWEATGGLIERVDPKTQVTEFKLEEVAAQLVEHGFPKELIETMTKDRAADETLRLFRQLSFEPGAEPVVALAVGDKVEFYRINDPDIYATITNLDPPTSKFFTAGLLRHGVEMVRTGAIEFNPVWILKNSVIDPITAFVHAPWGDKLAGLKRYLQLMSKVFTRPEKRAESVRRAMALGLRGATLTRADRPSGQGRAMRALMREPLGERAKAMMANPVAFVVEGSKLLRDGLGGLSELVNVGELIARAPTFEKALERAEQKWGKDTEDAVLEAMLADKEATANYTRSGSVARVASGGWVFFSARIAGVQTTLRQAAKNPASYLATALSIVTVPELLLWWFYKDEDWYKHTVNKDKSLVAQFFGLEFSIPKPFDIGHWFGTMPRQAMEKMFGDSPKEVSEIFADMLKTFVPIPEMVDLIGGEPRALVGLAPTILRPAAEVAANYVPFHGRELIDPDVKRWREPREQFTSNTTELAKIIGDALNVSPTVFEHLLRGYTGGIGLDLLRTAETVIGQRALRDPGAISTFVRPTRWWQSPWIDRVQEEMENLQRRKGSERATQSTRYWAKRFSKSWDRWTEIRRGAGDDKARRDAAEKRAALEAEKLWKEYEESGDR